MTMARVVSKVLIPKVCREGGGFKIRRVIGGAVDAICDPILMLDHMGPVVYGPNEAIGAPDHPHRGFETVSYILDGGEMQHKDSAGNSGTLGAGWVQWMTAGSGVVHSEMPSDNFLKTGGKMEGFQLWVNLPAKDKMIPPRYQDTPPEKIPVVTTPDNKVKVKIIAGSALGTNAYIETRVPFMYLDITMSTDATFTQETPTHYNGFVYVFRGAGKVGSSRTVVQAGQVAMITQGSSVTLSTSDQECRLLLIAGEPINESIVWKGGFVMNTQEQIDQAFDDYMHGRLGEIPGKEERYKLTNQAKMTQKSTGTWDKI